MTSLFKLKVITEEYHQIILPLSGVLFGWVTKSQYIAPNATSQALYHVDSFYQMSYFI